MHELCDVLLDESEARECRRLLDSHAPPRLATRRRRGWRCVVCKPNKLVASRVSKLTKVLSVFQFRGTADAPGMPRLLLGGLGHFQAGGF